MSANCMFVWTWQRNSRRLTQKYFCWTPLNGHYHTSSWKNSPRNFKASYMIIINWRMRTFVIVGPHFHYGFMGEVKCTVLMNVITYLCMPNGLNGPRMGKATKETYNVQRQEMHSPHRISSRPCRCISASSETKCKAAAFGSYCHAKMITPIWPSERETICEAFMVFLLDAGRSLINCFFQSRRNLSVEKLWIMTAIIIVRRRTSEINSYQFTLFRFNSKFAQKEVHLYSWMH